MEIGENELYELLAKIESRDRVIEEQIRLNNDLPDIFAKAFAEQMSQYTQQTRQEMWSLPIEIDLSVARTVPTLIGEYSHGADAIIYLPDSTGVGTIYLDNPVSHGYEMGVDYQKLRAYFRDIYLTNIAQPNAKLNLLVGQGDIDVRARTETSRSLLGKNQQKFYSGWMGFFAPESTQTIRVYDGKPGWQLYFGGGFVQCDADVPQLISLQFQFPGWPFIEILSYRYKMQGDINLTREPAVVRVEPGENVQFVMYNQDTDPHVIGFVLIGLEERVI